MKRKLPTHDLAACRLEVLGPRGGGGLEALLGFFDLRDHPFRLVAEFGFAFVEGFPRVAEGDLRFLERRAEFDGLLVLRHRRLEAAWSAIAVTAGVAPAAAAIARSAAVAIA